MPESESPREPLEWRLRAIVGEENVLVDEPMSEHTTFKVGGPADLYVIPESFDELREVLLACDEAGVRRFLLGRGSDLLVSDEGYRGVIVAVGDGLVGVSVDGTQMTCQAGVDLREASEMACELGLSGLEFACGIPGSVGGACFMNAGAYGGCVADVLESVRVLLPDGSQETLGVDELDLGYRRSRVASEGLVVLSATFDLEKGDPEKIRATMDDLTHQREEKQPLEMASAGSTFKRPEGHFAGKLIMDAGLQGYRVGGAEVSRKHAGFVVNTGGATAADVHAVIEHVQDEVERQFRVRLEPEVRFLG
ncbi:UDP-N-acetylmuramate dehydrogenase [Olsenella sp. DSM 107455]|uniref:UDP-N-acetylenolpyruvoylglucosamine reductase n=1 Tax=Thermophilibacter gallinarum TaxID=2779357 RepID=A0ABR9QTP6_9ACTN|nr:UDP-N-acetylmuramate dehydrogenase [Thermophilibacter gallinarum]MBE5024402.1 UDP-N-acetylmuramate dehydrogenase [Thermophilibacter gallinarum]